MKARSDTITSAYSNSISATAPNCTSKAELISPVPGSTLTSSSVTLTWSSGGGVSEYWLFLGTTPGGYDLYNGSQDTNLSRTITGLPTDGSTIYVRLFSAIDGDWPYNDFTYTIDCSGCSTAAAEMISPAPGSTLTSSSVIFTWSSGAGVSNYVLQVGTTSGAANIYIGLQGTNLSRTITGLPTDGSTIYVRLYSAIGGGWPFNDYTYNTAAPRSGVTFSTSELAGTWYFYGYSDLTSSNDPGWSRATLTLDSTGLVTDGSWVDSDGSSVTITSGSLSIDSTGVGFGSVTDFSGITTTLSHFKMDFNKNIVTGVSIDSDNYRGAGVLIKDEGTFSASDLAGTWYFYGFSDLNSSNDPGWSRATLTLDSTGLVTDGSWVDSNGSSVTITSGSLSLDSNGVGSGSVTDSSGVTTTLPHFKMDSNKTIVTGVSIDSDNYHGIGMLIRTD